MKQKKFIAQSYQDSWEDYSYSLSNPKAACWDWIMITASNERQAHAYELQIKKRKELGMLPLHSNIAVIPDLDGKRIGSGGATLNVLKYLTEQTGRKAVPQQKILLLHSGGDAKRIPQYSSCGKLFSPVPRVLPNGQPSCIFDELLIAFSGIPARITSGMMVMSGDTVMLFNPLQLDLLSCDTAAISIKADVKEGNEHGVFLGNEHGMADRFLHKQSIEVLQESGAVDAGNQLDIDTGCIWLGHQVVDTLLDLICENGSVSESLFRKFVNEQVCLSFYADFVYPLAQSSSLEQYYRETPEGTYSDELLQCRNMIWQALHPFSMKLIRLVPAKYVHFGTSSELFSLLVWEIEQYGYLGWKRQTFSPDCLSASPALYNSYVSPLADVSTACYIEHSIIHSNVSIGKNVMISGLELEHVHIPDGVVLHGLKLTDHTYVCRIYGLHDNPKASIDGSLLKNGIRKLLQSSALKEQDLWKESSASLWNACIYPACDSMQEAVAYALLLYDLSVGNPVSSQLLERYKVSKRYSLKESFVCADTAAEMVWQKKILDQICIENFISAMKKGNDIRKATACLQISNSDLIQAELLLKRAKTSDFPDNMRLYLTLSHLCSVTGLSINGLSSPDFEDYAYEKIRQAILVSVNQNYPMPDHLFHFRLNQSTVELPVRVNFCGSPSDAAPYCLEHGGTMLDGTILLKGKRPVQVTVTRLDKAEIILESVDLQKVQIFTDLNPLLECGDPYDPFALHKAVLAAIGFTAASNLSMQELCCRLGGGFRLTTSVEVPKGSGLGTSSILAAACMKALLEVFGQPAQPDKIYALVFAAEQLMNTGGGWQDQVGGLTPGLKYFHTAPGISQEIMVETLNLPEETMEELQNRFTLIFSGQRRLARNVLREEMNQCIYHDETALAAIEEIRRTCAFMKYELERGNITEFAHAITKQFELVKTIDQGASNTCIEYIFDTCEDLIDGKSICGAGGGGFLQVVLKKDVTKKMLEDRINHTFQNCGVEVWDCTFI